MASWKEGELVNLLQEGMMIQQIPKNKGKCSEEDSIKPAFVREMSKDHTKAAFRLLSKDNRGSFLFLSDTIPTASKDEHATVLDVLKSKHPPGALPSEDSIFEGAHVPSTVLHVIFDSIIGKTICSAALCTSGAVGPSVLMHKAAEDSALLLKMPRLALLLTRRLCRDFVDQEGLAPLMSCRLIALDKNP